MNTNSFSSTNKRHSDESKIYSFSKSYLTKLHAHDYSNETKNRSQFIEDYEEPEKKNISGRRNSETSLSYLRASFTSKNDNINTIFSTRNEEIRKTHSNKVIFGNSIRKYSSGESHLLKANTVTNTLFDQSDPIKRSNSSVNGKYKAKPNSSTNKQSKNLPPSINTNSNQKNHTSVQDNYSKNDSKQEVLEKMKSRNKPQKISTKGTPSVSNPRVIPILKKKGDANIIPYELDMFLARSPIPISPTTTKPVKIQREYSNRNSKKGIFGIVSKKILGIDKSKKKREAEIETIMKISDNSPFLGYFGDGNAQAISKLTGIPEHTIIEKKGHGKMNFSTNPFIESDKSDFSETESEETQKENRKLDRLSKLISIKSSIHSPTQFSWYVDEDGLSKLNSPINKQLAITDNLYISDMILKSPLSINSPSKTEILDTKKTANNSTKKPLLDEKIDDESTNSIPSTSYTIERSDENTCDTLKDKLVAYKCRAISLDRFEPSIINIQNVYKARIAHGDFTIPDLRKVNSSPEIGSSLSFISEKQLSDLNSTRGYVTDPEDFVINEVKGNKVLNIRKSMLKRPYYFLNPNKDSGLIRDTEFKDIQIKPLREKNICKSSFDSLMNHISDIKNNGQSDLYNDQILNSRKMLHPKDGLDNSDDKVNGGIASTFRNSNQNQVIYRPKSKKGRKQIGREASATNSIVANDSFPEIRDAGTGVLSVSSKNLGPEKSLPKSKEIFFSQHSFSSNNDNLIEEKKTLDQYKGDSFSQLSSKNFERSLTHTTIPSSNFKRISSIEKVGDSSNYMNLKIKADRESKFDQDFSMVGSKDSRALSHKISSDFSATEFNSKRFQVEGMSLSNKPENDHVNEPRYYDFLSNANEENFQGILAAENSKSDLSSTFGLRFNDVSLLGQNNRHDFNKDSSQFHNLENFNGKQQKFSNIRGEESIIPSIPYFVNLDATRKTNNEFFMNRDQYKALNNLLNLQEMLNFDEIIYKLNLAFDPLSVNMVNQKLRLLVCLYTNEMYKHEIMNGDFTTKDSIIMPLKPGDGSREVQINLQNFDDDSPFLNTYSSKHVSAKTNSKKIMSQGGEDSEFNSSSEDEVQDNSLVSNKTSPKIPGSIELENSESTKNSYHSDNPNDRISPKNRPSQDIIVVGLLKTCFLSAKIYLINKIESEYLLLRRNGVYNNINDFVIKEASDFMTLDANFESYNRNLAFRIVSSFDEQYNDEFSKSSQYFDNDVEALSPKVIISRDPIEDSQKDLNPIANSSLRMGSEVENAPDDVSILQFVGVKKPVIRILTPPFMENNRSQNKYYRDEFNSSSSSFIPLNRGSIDQLKNFSNRNSQQEADSTKHIEQTKKPGSMDSKRVKFKTTDFITVYEYNVPTESEDSEFSDSSSISSDEFVLSSEESEYDSDSLPESAIYRLKFLKNLHNQIALNKEKDLTKDVVSDEDPLPTVLSEDISNKYQRLLRIRNPDSLESGYGGADYQKGDSLDGFDSQIFEESNTHYPQLELIKDSSSIIEARSEVLVDTENDLYNRISHCKSDEKFQDNSLIDIKTKRRMYLSSESTVFEPTENLGKTNSVLVPSKMEQVLSQIYKKGGIYDETKSQNLESAENYKFKNGSQTSGYVITNLISNEADDKALYERSKYTSSDDTAYNDKSPEVNPLILNKNLSDRDLSKSGEFIHSQYSDNDDPKNIPKSGNKGNRISIKLNQNQKATNKEFEEYYSDFSSSDDDGNNILSSKVSINRLNSSTIRLYDSTNADNVEEREEISSRKWKKGDSNVPITFADDFERQIFELRESLART
ncbi:hypothetical protein AYI68_g4830 [Smittium mucronatum]|uniref:Uncharacterized protein n=1 Tax=Smittium mucronatum TaxID=133383 RepID=A0A1R0GVY9_9FUNG|nr:hypothetical protein AYI68_g4830 [Smittium mucronatum]